MPWPESEYDETGPEYDDEDDFDLDDLDDDYYDDPADDTPLPEVLNGLDDDLWPV